MVGVTEERLRNLFIFYLLFLHILNGADVDKFDSVPVDEECKKGYFRCSPTSGRCLAQLHWCDNRSEECEHGEDETIENCEASGGFKKLFMKDNPAIITTVEPEICIVRDIPDACICMFSTRVWCDGKQLTSLPSGLQNNITHLYLSNNSIDLKPWMFKNITTLVNLYLMQNRIVNIPKETFYGLTRLEKLLLGENRIKKLQSGVFKDNLALKWVFLKDNMIEYIAPDVFENLSKLDWLNLSENLLRFTEDDIIPLNHHVTYVEMEANDIEVVGKNLFSMATNLEVLYLDRNKIRKIHEAAFRHLRNLSDLVLSDNLITNLPRGLFSSNILLENLNLKGNPITTIPHDLFQGLINLNMLNLSELTIRNIDKTIFEGLPRLEHIYFSTFQYCRYALNVRKCEPKSDGISSFNNLLDMDVLRVCIWIVATITVVGNIGVFFVRCKVKTDSHVHSIIIRNLCVCDFLMGVYLLTMASHDIAYRGVYNRYALDWMMSWRCIGGGVIAVVSAQVSICIVLFMSVERYVTISYPYKTCRLGDRWTILILASIWAVGIAMAVIPLTSSTAFGNFYSINGVCLPLHIHDPYMKGWEYSAAVFLVTNTICLVIVVYCYISMFADIMKTSRSVHRQILEDMVLAKRFVMIVFTDACCWLPIIVIKILAFAHYQIPNDCYAWVTIFVLPLNSALNPVVYSLSTPAITNKVSKLFAAKDKAENSSHWHNSSGFYLRSDGTEKSSPTAPPTFVITEAEEMKLQTTEMSLGNKTSGATEHGRLLGHNKRESSAEDHM